MLNNLFSGGNALNPWATAVFFIAALAGLSVRFVQKRWPEETREKNALIMRIVCLVVAMAAFAAAIFIK